MIFTDCWVSRNPTPLNVSVLWCAEMACRLFNSLTRSSDIRSRVSRLWWQAFCACVSAWIAQTGCACTELSSLQLLETAQHNTLVLCLFCEPNLITAEGFWKAAERFQDTSDTIVAFVQVLHVANHTMLGFNQHKMIKSHVVNPPVVKNRWLSSLIGSHLPLVVDE